MPYLPMALTPCDIGDLSTRPILSSTRYARMEDPTGAALGFIFET